jgi:hypothetical protein
MSDTPASSLPVPAPITSTVPETLPTFTQSQVALQFIHPSNRTFGIALAPGVIPLADNGAMCLFVLELIDGVWGLAGNSFGAELLIGIGLSTYTTAGSVSNFLSGKFGAIGVINEYFSVNLFPNSTPVSPPPPPPASGITTDAEAQAAIFAGIGKLTITMTTVTAPPVFSLSTGEVTD